MTTIREGDGRPAQAAGGGAIPIPPKRYRVGEIIEHTGISRQTLHTYTLLGLITEESSTMAGHRLYDETVFARLTRIQEMKREDKTLREIRAIFDAEAAASAEADGAGRRKGKGE